MRRLNLDELEAMFGRRTEAGARERETLHDEEKEEKVDVRRTG
jgi:hypothetical protein